jgi:tetratricopeptide (TPR) repeat protein
VSIAAVISAVRGRRWLALVAALLLAASGCASMGGSGRPADSRQSALARAHLAQVETVDAETARAHLHAALTAALEGIAARPGNPQHHFLAGVAHAGLGQLVEAHALWREALEMWPAYGDEIIRFREQAWQAAFERGLAAHREGRMDAAIAEWEGANLIFPWRPEAYFNLGAVRAEQGDFEGALDMYRHALGVVEQAGPGPRPLSEREREEREVARRSAREALAQLYMFLSRYGQAELEYRALLAENGDDVDLRSHLAVALVRQGRTDDAAAIFDALLATPDLDYRELTRIGLGLFHGRELARAAHVFQRAAELNPQSRDAVHNRVLALYEQRRWSDLVEPAERLLGMDPLNQSIALILAHALREMGETQLALAVLQRTEAHPVYLSHLHLNNGNEQARMRGQVVPAAAPRGARVNLRFVFLDLAGAELESRLVTVSAPAPGESATFEILLTPGLQPAGYRYRIEP